MKLIDLELYLKEYLEIARFKDYCPKGLIVEGNTEVLTGITGVSLSLELIEVAIAKNADFILVHHPHGFWENQSTIIRGVHKQKIERLLNHGISLFGFHLPLDAHPVVGNNVLIAQSLGLKPCGGFLNHSGQDIGLIAEYENAISRNDFIQLVDSEIGTSNCQFLFGTEFIRKVGICSGSAPHGIEEAQSLGLDLYLTGEARENTQSFCKDEQLNYIAAGHHKTEVYGVRALASHLSQRFEISVEFVDIDNPI
jgi:dinuclear metal center YbgI/SA1388 family protein